MIFVDSNIPMYLVGAPHPNKKAAERLVSACIGRGETLVTDTEALQEILHRYVAIRRLEAIQAAFDALLGLVDDVFAVALQHVQRAKEIVLGRTALSARDALHVAIMEVNEVTEILTFDTGFDQVPGITRVR